MKNLLKKITLSLSLAIFLGFPATASSQSLTSSQIQQINSGLFRSNYQDWFLQGNRQLEQEVRILLQQLLTSEGEILEIDEKLRSELCHKELQISARNFDTINGDRIARFNTKVKNLCQHY
ncbi:hypothetical protein [Tychonema sp. BBK16]|uniref:hypothetical protein n=1 Tax=Tychonema sp. BBK16 TaxID=2699888 RepID=UPI001F287C74|nr:hypothetical protein [Tychonema sp. BBK16]MCF6375081.1 hypothetical protein [Tychonema sp. BBK16]